ncbi:polysaccharide pyruvyl transferase family protein [Marinivivus vitaminiproducens]|uniref:polysaccharide pyruvyl transferase family protein n=1 Tax=Marinivivus vitaminiproducens TaxID=3035935 RepID=UPI0027A6F6BA|nr:polysaccharide pyruvyl transferase family protein [Geminicoccaceae bacterium SCSIO 64248]
MAAQSTVVAPPMLAGATERNGTGAAAQRRVGVWGHFHGRNQGDELVVSVVIEAIRAHLPEADIVAISSAPADTRRRHRVAALPMAPGDEAPTSSADAQPGPSRSEPAGRARSSWAWTARKLRRVQTEFALLYRAQRGVAGLDLLIVAGSGQLTDIWGGPLTHPWRTFAWALACRMRGVPYAMLSIGTGPIEAAGSRWLVRKAVEWASYVSVREPSAARALRQIGVRRDVPIVPDMAFGWSRDGRQARRDTSHAAAVVGLNVMAHADSRYWPQGNDRRYRAYIGKLAEVAARLIEDGHAVRLFSSHLTADRGAAEDVERLVRDRLGYDGDDRLIRAPVDGLDDLLREVEACDFVIACRFHSVLLPLKLGRPTIGLAYQAKTYDLMALLGQSAFCMDIDDFTVDELHDRFLHLRAGGDIVSRRLAQRVPLLREEVENQFTSVLAELAGPVPAGAHEDGTAGLAKPVH